MSLLSSHSRKVSNASFFVSLLLLPIAVASGQTGQSKSLATEPLEKYDNPPAYIFRLETSPRMISRYGLFTSHQVNVDANGNNIVGDAANEPSIAVDPTNLNKMTIGWRQFNSVSSNFRQGGWGYTTDGGTTWTFPGVLENNVFRSDPVLNSNETGNFFYLSLRQTFYDDMWGSLNSGQSWTRLTLGDVTGGDKQWFTIDKTKGIGHGFQYQAWSTGGNNWGGRQFSRSTDGGVTWMNPIFIPNSPVWGTLDVDTNGNLFIGGGDFGSQFFCVRSSNAQNPAVTPTFDQTTSVNLGGSIIFGGAINPGGLAGQIFLAVDRSGTATNNYIYMLASVEPPGRSTTDVMFVRSTDGGLTFSAPHRVNDDPANPTKWHWFGTFSVAPNGRLDAVWYDTRNAANNTDSQLFYSFSTDGGVTWSANVAVSDPFNPFEGYPNQNKLGDYITIVSDETGGNVAYAATFNFNPFRGQHEQDVYYVRVSPSGGPTPTPTPTCTPVFFFNPAPIIIPDSGPASPYPSNIVVAGQGTVVKVTVTLRSLIHFFPDDLDFLLVGPQGQNAIIWSDAGGEFDVLGLDVTLDDDAPSPLPDSAQIVSGTYRPANYGTGDTWPAPAPTPLGGSALSIFNGTDPNGTWSLYLVDDAGGNNGVVDGGWILRITTTCPSPTPTPTATPTPSPTPTPTPTPPPTPTPTPTPAPTPTPTVTPPPRPPRPTPGATPPPHQTPPPRP